MQISVSMVKRLGVEAAKEWSEDKASRLGAALAYYTVFSLAPLLLITIAIIGFFYGDEAAQGQISSQMSQLVGPKAAEAIEGMIQGAGEKKGQGIFATVISIALLLFGASGVFVQLKDALNTIWDLPPQKAPKGILGFLKSRVLSLGFVLGVGFLLLVSLILSAILSGVGNYMSGVVPMASLLQALNFIVSFGVITVLFAMIYKFLPDIKLPWRDVWLGALFTALLFSIGKWLLGLYLGRSSMASTYGAAGSFVVLLVWIYYSAQIVFFGAEVTQVYSRTYGACKGRLKRTEKQKSGYYGADGKPVEKGDTAIDPAAVTEVPPAGVRPPNKIGAAVGKIAGYAVAGQAVADGLKDKHT